MEVVSFKGQYDAGLPAGFNPINKGKRTRRCNIQHFLPSPGSSLFTMTVFPNYRVLLAPRVNDSAEVKNVFSALFSNLSQS